MPAFTGGRYEVNNIIINKIWLHKLWKVPLKRKSWCKLHLDLCSKLLPFVLIFQSVKLPELITISWRITYIEPCSPVCTTYRGRVAKCKFWVRHMHAVCMLRCFSCVWLCTTLWTAACPWDSVHEILQARILEWVAISFSRTSFQPRNQTQVSCIAGMSFTNWAMRKPHK